MKDKVRWLSYLFPQVILEKSSNYNQDIKVILEQGKYKLLVNGSRQSGKYIDAMWEYSFKKFKKYFKRIKPKQVLVLGLAGGTVISLLHKKYELAKFTAVDIDKVMVDIGKKYFGLNKIISLEIHILDAYDFVIKSNRKTQKYDLVIIDLFIGRHIPDFVQEEEFLFALKEILADKGMMLINYSKEKEYDKKSQIIINKLRSMHDVVEYADREKNRFILVSLSKNN